MGESLSWFAVRGKTPVITRITSLDPVQMEPLVAASQYEGFRFIVRLCDDWDSTRNRFDQPGEAMYGVYIDAGLIGVGGINRQDESTGRLRRFYILPAHRRRGWGRALLSHILNHAAGHFRWVVLRTDTAAADCFYRACGFAQKEGFGEATHWIELPSALPQAV
jgi:GNAT superfamily N-acetyltransferase